MKLEINYRKKIGKFTNMWKLNNTLLNNQWVKEGIKREIKKILKQTKMEHNIPKLMGCSKSSSRMKFVVLKVYMMKKERSQTT